MALRALMLKRSIERKKEELDALRAKDAEFAAREAEIESAIGEANTDEEQAAVKEEVEHFEEDRKKHEKTKETLAGEIGALETELDELEKQPPARSAPAMKQERKETPMENTRTKFFGMNAQERDAFFQREDVKSFLTRTRELGREKRAISGAELLIPTVVLDLVREETERYSKLLSHVMVRRVPGKARQNIMGTVPEAVWTEMCATLNELSLRFYDVEVDGYKVGGYIAICNAVLEDSDISLAAEIINAIGQAIGLAIDKAILYGTGTKMPMGILTRLAQTVEPSNYPTTARPWANLSASNILSISGKTDAALFKALVEATGAAKNRGGLGGKFWAMNERTHTKLISNALTINAAGAIVTGVSNSMPLVGGAIVTLEFIPNDVIIGGYGDRYLMAERAGTALAASEHVRFIEDQTVFKGTARYDGLPVIPEAFVAVGINGNTPNPAAVTFAEDSANTPAEDSDNTPAEDAA